MDAGDWIQSAIGIFGIMATVALAIFIFRKEGKDKANERREDQLSQQKKERADLDRDRKAVRREQHKDDYRAANDALSTLEKIFEEVERQPHTFTEFEESELQKASESIEAVSRRVPSLTMALNRVWWAASAVDVHSFPDKSDFRLAMRKNDTDSQGDSLHDAIRAAVNAGLSQYHAAKDGQKAVLAARKAIQEEWGS